MSIDRRSVEIAIDEIRPQFLFDGGDIQLLDVAPDGVVTINLSGICGSCSASAEHVKYGVEYELKKWIPKITRVVVTENY